MKQTIDYYNHCADGFFEETLSLPMEHLYSEFLCRLKPGCHILDAGCGSGRDAANFATKGFTVSAFDASSELIIRARKRHNNISFTTCTFLEFSSNEKFAGIWACASLLHVERARLVETISHLTSLLDDEGIFYASFKYGEGDMVKRGRYFINFTPEIFEELVGNIPQLTTRKIWKTPDNRPARDGEFWLNILMKKSTD